MDSKMFPIDSKCKNLPKSMKNYQNRLINTSIKYKSMKIANDVPVSTLKAQSANLIEH